MPLLVALTWDTDHFGVKVGRLTLQSGDTARRIIYLISRGGLDCVIARTATENVEEANLLEESGFRLKDIKLHLGLDLTQYHPRTFISGFRIVNCRERDLDQIRRISKESFWATHFHNDERFNRDKVNEMYSLWIDKSIREKCTILAASRGSKVAGFLVSKIVEGSFYVDLVATDGNFRGKGIGHDLVVFGLNQAKSNLRKAAITVQLGNIPAIRLYEKMGFRMSSSESTFHRWSKPLR